MKVIVEVVEFLVEVVCLLDRKLMRSLRLDRLVWLKGSVLLDVQV